MLMGNIKKRNLVTFLLLSLLFFHSCSSSNEFQYYKNLGWSPSDYNNKAAPLLSPHDDHEYMIKNSEPPYFMKKQSTRDEEEEGGLITNNNKKSKRNMKKKKMKMKTRSLNLKSSSNREKSSSSDNWSRKRTYSAMLPKGFVPPSGSSPCHNTYPNSVTFFCHLSTSNKLP